MDIIATIALVAARSRGLTIREVAAIAGIDPHEARRAEIATIAQGLPKRRQPHEEREREMRSVLLRVGRAFAACSLSV